MSGFVVKIEYKNQNLETVIEKEYDLLTYTSMLYMELMGIVKEVEDVFYEINQGKQKQDWTPESMERFKRIRHKMLDQANAIRRLPQNLSHNGVKANQVTMGEYLNLNK